jgi:chromosome segregation ATPase
LIYVLPNCGINSNWTHNRIACSRETRQQQSLKELEMKQVFLCLLLLFFTSATALAQATSASRPTSEQSLQELVREVRQLRTTLQRINTTMYKGQVLLERFRLQQEQVARTARELADARETLIEIKAAQTRLNDLLTKVEAGVEKGEKHPSELASVKAEFESLKEREPRLIAREIRLANDLELERARLNDLNDRLNALELELTPGKP